MSHTQKKETVRQAVRDRYGEIARQDTPGGCGGTPSPCCGEPVANPPASPSAQLGYSQEELGNVPDGADLGLGCGNPQAIAALRPGETVLDLGSGGGFDCFLAARQVGEAGRVIGVDMTPEMVAKARANVEKTGYANVEFRLGEIEHLPVADASVDAIISNCVINLSPDKAQVFADAWRVLRPGGRLAITDVVALTDLPDQVASDLALHVGCVAGAARREELESMLQEAGFQEVRIRPIDASREVIAEWAPGTNVEDYVTSATVEAINVG